MHSNSAKNYYYKTLKFLRENPIIAKNLDIDLQNFEIKKFDKFNASEKFDLLKTVDESSAKADISRNEFINQCIVFALEHLEEK